MAEFVLDFQFTSSINQVWTVLTGSDMLAKWMWKNDFKSVVGYKFTYRAELNEWWEDIVESQVLEVNEPHSLPYTRAQVQKFIQLFGL